MSTSLTEAVARYLLTHRLRANSQYQLSRTVALFEAYLRRSGQTCDLTDLTVSAWIAELERSYGQRTVADHRVNILRLWRDAARYGDCQLPANVRPAPKPQPLPIAWTLEELRTVIAVCSVQRGAFQDGRPKALYLVTLIHADYDTGLRRSDLWELDRSQVRPDGVIILRQSKTGWPHFPRLRDKALQGFKRLGGQKPLRCPYKHTGDFYKMWGGIVAQARVRRGAMQQIRRTGASHLAVDHPESVQGYLGHRTPTMQRHYVDRSIAQQKEAQPPEL